MDEELFKKLDEQGFISAEPNKYWLPLQTKDRMWQNYYPGRGGVILHLSGGWMIKPDTFELNQIESKDIDFSSQNHSSYISNLDNSFTDNVTPLIRSVQSVFDQLGYEYETIKGDVVDPRHTIVVRHKFSILGDKTPLTLRFRSYGFDPKKAMNSKFEKVLHSVIPGRFEVNVHHVPDYDSNGEELSTFGETGLVFTTEIDQPITIDNFPRFLEVRRKEIDDVLSKLKDYRFDDEPNK